MLLVARQRPCHIVNEGVYLIDEITLEFGLKRVDQRCLTLERIGLLNLAGGIDWPQVLGLFNRLLLHEPNLLVLVDDRLTGRVQTAVFSRRALKGRLSKDCYAVKIHVALVA